MGSARCDAYAVAIVAMAVLVKAVRFPFFYKEQRNKLLLIQQMEENTLNTIRNSDSLSQFIDQTNKPIEQKK